MNGHELRAALRGGQRVFGTMLTAAAPHWCDLLAGTGIDWVFLDTEHIPANREAIGWLCRAYAARGVAPLVRIPEPDAQQAAMALDAGAHGVIVPYVESAAQVREVAGATHYRPLKGERRDAALRGELDPTTARYLADFNRHAVLACQVESVAGLRNLDEILAVPELDAVFIGPHDLSVSLGVPEQWDSPVLDAAVREILTRTRAAGRGAGFHWWLDWSVATPWVGESGANFVSYSSDIAQITASLAPGIERLRGL